MDKARLIILRIVMTIIIFYLCFVGYIKLSFPFWSRQPVFHFYNLYYWVKPNQIIEKELPDNGRFFDETIIFDEFKNLSESKKDLFIEFIKNNYMPNECEKYLPTRESIIDIFDKHNNKSFISLKLYNNEILSSVVSTPLNFKIDTKNILAYYADFLCVDKQHRNKMYAGIQAYTHYYYGRKKTNNDVVLFKRENQSNFIVPFSVYNNYIFKIDNWELCYTFDQPNISIVFVGKSNLNMFNTIFQESKNKFNVFISHDLGNIFHMIDKNHLIICCLMINQVFVSYYVFKNPHTTYYGVKSLECCCSYKSESLENNLFTLGYMISMSLVSKDIQSKIILIEDLADNNIIINLLLKKYQYFAKTVNSLYLYNYACYPKYSNEIMIII